MFSELVEKHRSREIARYRKMKSFEANWPTWKSEIDKLTKSLTDADAIFSLGGRLSEIFKSTGGEGRNQSTQSAGGTGWEALVSWYLNLVFCGTRAIAFRQNKPLVPPAIFDAATVKYGSHKTNTESDISVVVFPQNMDELGKGSATAKLDRAIRRDLGDTHLRIIQCKTNWNDNAQIPMLWDMVYQGNFPDHSTVRIGTGGVTVRKLGSFKYCFVTVPTNKNEYRSDTLAVKRLGGMTGGNYWGQASKPGVAESLAEIFTNEFDFVFPSSVTTSIEAAISEEIGPFGVDQD